MKVKKGSTKIKVSTKHSGKSVQSFQCRWITLSYAVMMVDKFRKVIFCIDAWSAQTKDQIYHIFRTRDNFKTAEIFGLSVYHYLRLVDYDTFLMFHFLSVYFSDCVELGRCRIVLFSEGCYLRWFFEVNLYQAIFMTMILIQLSL